MTIFIKGHWLFILLLIAGCAGPSKTKAPEADIPVAVYYSRPEVMKVSNHTFEVDLKPIKVQNPYYVGFQLTVRNKTSGVLSIDWNRTRFIHEGQDQGKFIFKGIPPDRTHQDLPNESIPGGALLSKPIYPLKTAVFNQKADVLKEETCNFSPGILPVGTNAVLLAIAHGERQWRQAMAFKLGVEDSSKIVPVKRMGAELDTQ